MNLGVSSLTHLIQTVYLIFEPLETENSYNRPGTFIAWKDSEHHVLDGHSRQCMQLLYVMNIF